MIACFESIRGGQLRGVQTLKGCKAAQVRWGNPSVASVYAITCSSPKQGRSILMQMGVELGDETQLSRESMGLVEALLAGDESAEEELLGREWFD